MPPPPHKTRSLTGESAFNEKEPCYCYDIVYICDENYVMPACVSIQSLWENRTANEEYNVYVIGVDLSEKSINKLLSIKLDKLNLKFIQYKDKYRDLYGDISSHVSPAALVKFDIPNILNDKDKVLYIDCDTLINKEGGIKELFNIDIKDVYAGVVKDIPILYDNYNEKLGVENYFNSGMILMNLDLMRKDKVTEKLINCKTKHYDEFVDQDAFNRVLDKKVKYLPFKFNYLSVTDAPIYYNYYDYDEKSNPVIIHFASVNKPWKNAVINYADIWYEYFKKTPFKNQKLKRAKKLIYKQKFGNTRIINFLGFKFKYYRPPRKKYLADFNKEQELRND